MGSRNTVTQWLAQVVVIWDVQGVYRTDGQKIMSHLQFNLLATDGAARRGRLSFLRGIVDTPAFMPVGTYGSVKGVLPEQIQALGAQIILGNAFHLHQRPGLEVIEAHSGLHGFMRWGWPDFD